MEDDNEVDAGAVLLQGLNPRLPSPGVAKNKRLCPCACGNEANVRYPKWALLNVGKLKDFLRLIGVKAEKRGKLVMRYFTSEKAFASTQRISDVHLDSTSSSLVRRLVLGTPRQTTKTAAVFSHKDIPVISPEPRVSPVDVAGAVTAVREAATSKQPVRALSRLLATMLGQERESLEVHIDLLTNTVAHANAQLSELQGAAVQPLLLLLGLKSGATYGVEYKNWRATPQ